MFWGPVSVELVDGAAVEDQVVAGQVGCEGSVVWVEDDLGVVVVEPLTDQWEPGFIHRLFGAEQQPVPVRAVGLLVGGGESVSFGGGGDEA